MVAGDGPREWFEAGFGAHGDPRQRSPRATPQMRNGALEPTYKSLRAEVVKRRLLRSTSLQDPQGCTLCPLTYLPRPPLAPSFVLDHRAPDYPPSRYLATTRIVQEPQEPMGIFWYVTYLSRPSPSPSTLCSASTPPYSRATSESFLCVGAEIT
jgi:hypothetical protein